MWNRRSIVRDVDRDVWLKDVMRRKLERFDVLYPPGYDRSWGRIGEEHGTYLRKVIQSVDPGGLILDAACGTGRFFSMIVDSGRQVLGVDWSEGMLERATLKFPDIRTERRHLQDLGFGRGFDGVICVDALENLPPEHWPAALNALHRAAKPAVLVYFTVELAADDTDLESSYDAARAKGWPVVPGEVAEDDGYHYYPERPAVRRWLDETRLEIVDQSEADGYWHLLCRAAPHEIAR
jgi:ubiquinone/menaquinone biosynthesis C-methylase UbiE